MPRNIETKGSGCDMALDNIRNAIDKTDDKILEFFLERMELVKAVAENKAEKGVSIRGEERERDILKRVRSESGDMEQYTHKLFTMLFELSRSYQEALRYRGIQKDKQDY